MSKKPLVRSKKRAVHTNTKDKLSKLIAEVDSIAKELSKVKKGGMGIGITSAFRLVSDSKTQNFFTRISNMLKNNKTTIMNIKYSFIDLLIDSHIKFLNNNYVSTYNNNILNISTEINDLITNLISGGVGIYGYNELNVDNITQIQRNGQEDNIVNMKKIAHILNIMRYLYKEVKDYNVSNDVTNDFDKNTHYTDLKINQILFGAEDNNKKFRYTFMNKLKNDLMKNIFEFVSKISGSSGGDQSDLITSINNLYISINNKKIFEYLPNLEILHNLGSLGNTDEIVNNINSLKRIKLKYDIYTKIICTESTNNLFIHDDTLNKTFKFLDNYNIIANDTITTIDKLKEAIRKFKLENIIKKDESDRKKSSRFVSFLTTNKKEMRSINDILIKLKENLDILRNKNKSFASDSAKIRNDINIINKQKALKDLDDLKDNLEKSISNDIKIFNNIKEKLIIKYKAEHVDKNDATIYKEYNAYFKEKIISLDFVKEDIEKFNLNEELVEQTVEADANSGGKLVTKYKSTGDSVYILYKRKKIKRCVYEKTKGRGKYCKVDGEYKLLSKLKIM